MKYSPYDLLKSLPFYFLPHHFISWVCYFLARIKWRPAKDRFIRLTLYLHPMNMQEAVEEDPYRYESLNALFVRALKPEARPLDNKPESILCPVDGRISQIGNIKQGRIFQAKNFDYSLLELCGGQVDLAAPFLNGKFTTIYLSPVDYHRVHISLPGQLKYSVYVPGRLFSVAPHTVRSIPRIFSRNERLVCYFDTEAGPMIQIMVGAINVSAIDTVWQEKITPPSGFRIRRRSHINEQIRLARGEEMGRFNLGSTVILLMPENIQWNLELQPGVKVSLGQSLGAYSKHI